ncbi:ABC transporter [Aurantiacibacter sp. MUD11]|uniref:ABC transporter n=1 Tax=Aurantiacibacter sp. MUD11 TaxID=3003265 RepID=UPI0022AAD33F|nr:ABC transporter [Aurantiacibacter sp. MUD11]WAT19053.1 ABC transporter [Aurantiacibacter sp. MUD11]
MPRASKLPRLLAGLAAMLLAATSAHADDVAEAPARDSLALMGTVPIYWGEAGGLDELISGDGQTHWAREVIAQHGEPVPLDYLSQEALAQHRNLLMAQPRGLSPEENVALDAWVRGGGRLLLFADPMMTGESRFHIGDRRRPQDVALLSPILAHWGLELSFDPAQAAGLQLADHFGDPLPVNMRGEWRYVEAEADQPCNIPGDGLLAHCRLGAGQALLVADAAMLDIAGPYDHAENALAWLIGHALGMARENPRAIGDSMRDRPGNETISSEMSQESARD